MGRLAAFSGHMIDDAGRSTPRFPSECEASVAAAIEARLRALDVTCGVSSAARGADLLFLERLLARGGRAHVLLPFARHAFAETSVGEAWRDRYEAVLDHPRARVRILSDAVPAHGARRAAYAACNAAVRREAVERARRHGIAPVLIVVWNGDPSVGAGDTADAVRAWRETGHALERIDIGSLEIPSEPRR